jgi:hypothetical protein
VTTSQRILIINVAATLFMVGLIWIIQIVHYPLFDGVGAAGFTSYQQRHQSQITLIVAPVMLTELVTAILLLLAPPLGVRKPSILASIGLLVLIWLSTAFIQVPCHERLVTGFDADTYRWLVQSNWIRTLAWTARGLLVLGFVRSVFQALAKRDP